MFSEAPVALNHPGNFSIAPFDMTNWLPAPETVNASFKYGLIAVGFVVTTELSRIKAPPAFTVRAYPMWLASFENLRPPLIKGRLPPERSEERRVGKGGRSRWCA